MAIENIDTRERGVNMMPAKLIIELNAGTRGPVQRLVRVLWEFSLIQFMAEILLKHAGRMNSSVCSDRLAFYDSAHWLSSAIRISAACAAHPPGDDDVEAIRCFQYRQQCLRRAPQPLELGMG